MNSMLPFSLRAVVETDFRVKTLGIPVEIHAHIAGGVSADTVGELFSIDFERLAADFAVGMRIAPAGGHLLEVQ